MPLESIEVRLWCTACMAGHFWDYGATCPSMTLWPLFKGQMWSLNAGFFTVCLWALASLNVSGLIHSDESGFTERGWGDHASFNNMRRAGQMPELSYWGLHLDHPVLKVNHAAMKKIRELKMCDNGWGIMVCFKWDIHFIAGFQFRISFHFRSFFPPPPLCPLCLCIGHAKA